MNWLLTAIVCVLLVELAVRLPFATTVAGLSRSSSRAFSVVRARASDHWKEKAMAAYARLTFLSSIRLAGLLAVLLLAAAILVLVFEQISGDFRSFILGWRGIVSGLAFASLYLTARKAIAGGRL